MNTENRLQAAVTRALNSLYGADVKPESIAVSVTRKDQRGDYTVVTFPLSKISKVSPEETGKQIGQYLKEKEDIVEEFETIKGFLNII